MAADDYTPEKHFIDQHRRKLIEKVNKVNNILDMLFEEKVITKEDYDNVRKKVNNQEMMRELWTLLNSRKAKDIFYQGLKEYEEYLLDDLSPSPLSVTQPKGANASDPAQNIESHSMESPSANDVDIVSDQSKDAPLTDTQNVESHSMESPTASDVDIVSDQSKGAPPTDKPGSGRGSFYTWIRVRALLGALLVVLIAAVCFSQQQKEKLNQQDLINQVEKLTVQLKERELSVLQQQKEKLTQDQQDLNNRVKKFTVQLKERDEDLRKTREFNDLIDDEFNRLTEYRTF